MPKGLWQVFDTKGQAQAEAKRWRAGGRNRVTVRKTTYRGKRVWGVYIYPKK